MFSVPRYTLPPHIRCREWLWSASSLRHPLQGHRFINRDLLWIISSAYWCNRNLDILARSVRSFFYRFRYRLDKSIKIAGLFHWDVHIIFFLLLQNLNPYFQNGGQKTKMAAKNRETNITGLIIDLQSRVICRNVRCLNMYLIWPLNAILIILIWPQKSKMAAQNRKTNITWLVINLRSRVICQNVCYFYIYTNTLLYMIFMISILPPKSKMAAKDCETNIIGFIIDIQSRVKCQNLRFLNMGIKLELLS